MRKKIKTPFIFGTFGLLLLFASSCGPDSANNALTTGGSGSGEDGNHLSDLIEKNASVLYEVNNTVQKQIDHPFLPFAGTVEANPTHRLSQIFSGTLENSYLDGKLTNFLFGSRSHGSLETKEDLLELIGEGFHWQELYSGETISGTFTSRSQLLFHGIPIASASAVEQQDISNSRWLGASIPGWVGRTLGQGFAPQLQVTEFSYTAQAAREKYTEQTGFDIEYVTDGQTYYVATESGLRAAYRYVIQSESGAEVDGTQTQQQANFPHVPLVAFVDADNGSIIEQYPLAFHVDGSARLYRENSIASRQEGLIDTRLPDLSGDGSSLRHSIFDVKNCRLNPVGSQCAFAAAASQASDYKNISPESENYDELVAYYAITRAIEWYRKLMNSTSSVFPLENSWKERRLDFGLNPQGKDRLTVYVRALSQTPQRSFTTDNAVYLPAGTTGTSAPEILIGTGWEAGMNTPPRFLRYIGKDADVSMHEFAHHIVFRSITEIKGQGLAMHEGFSDYFTYAITGNNLLAESVVAEGNSLRSGTKRGTLAQYPPATTAAHAAGEFWSTVLWDIRTSLGEWKDGLYQFDVIAYHAIDLMQSAETYYGAIAALAKATTSFANHVGQDPIALREKMFAHFFKRGFIGEPKGTGELPPPSALLTSATANTELSGASQSAPQPSQDAPKPKNPPARGMSCTIGSNLAASDNRNDIGTLLLLIACISMPILPISKRKIMRYRRATVRVKRHF